MLSYARFDKVLHRIKLLSFSVSTELGGGPDDVEVARMHQVGAHGDVDFFHGEGVPRSRILRRRKAV